MRGEPAARADEIMQDPQFQTLVRQRTRFAWLLTALILIIYFGFILLVAFEPGWLGTPIGDGVTSIGIPIGIGVIVSAFLLTGAYVLRANGQFDSLATQLLERHK